MPSFQGSSLAGSSRQCGPALMIGMAGAVLAIFGSIWVFSHRNTQTRPHTDKTHAISNLPTQ